MTSPTPRILRYAALAAACCIAPAAAQADGGHLPDAEILATNNTAVITDPADPRLDDELRGFERKVERIIRRGGGDPEGSQLLDGVFFSSDLGTTTFERSRDFDVDDVTQEELREIADTVRVRFGQQSVLTFDYPERPWHPVDAVEVEVPGLDAQSLRDGLLADAEARETLFGGSVTLDGRLLLIAGLEDLELVERFVTDIGGEFEDATIRPGRREFVGF
jgi:hypothetical protein